MRKASQLQCWALGALALGLLALAAWSQTPAPAGQEAPIRLQLLVPADAKIFVDGNATRQTGPVRRFESPPVPLNKTFTYQIKITWTVNGEEKSVEKRVRVRAGENQLDYRNPSGEKIAPAPDTTKRTDKARRTDKTKRTDKAKRTDKMKKDVVPVDKAKTDEADTKDTKKEDKAPPDVDKAKGDKAPKDEKDLKDRKAPDDQAEAPRSREFLFTYATPAGPRPGLIARARPAPLTDRIGRRLS